MSWIWDRLRSRGNGHDRDSPLIRRPITILMGICRTGSSHHLWCYCKRARVPAEFVHTSYYKRTARGYVSVNSRPLRTPTGTPRIYMHSYMQRLPLLYGMGAYVCIYTPNNVMLYVCACVCTWVRTCITMCTTRGFVFSSVIRIVICIYRLYPMLHLGFINEARFFRTPGICQRHGPNNYFITVTFVAGVITYIL